MSCPFHSQRQGCPYRSRKNCPFQNSPLIIGDLSSYDIKRIMDKGSKGLTESLYHDIKRQEIPHKQLGESMGLVTEVMCVDGVCKEIAYAVALEDGDGPVSKKLKKVIKSKKSSRKRKSRSRKRSRKSRKRKSRSRKRKKGGHFIEAKGIAQVGTLGDGGIRTMKKYKSSRDSNIESETKAQRRKAQLVRSLSQSRLLRNLSPKARKLEREFSKASKKYNL